MQHRPFIPIVVRDKSRKRKQWNNLVMFYIKKYYKFHSRTHNQNIERIWKREKGQNKDILEDLAKNIKS